MGKRVPEYSWGLVCDGILKYKHTTDQRLLGNGDLDDNVCMGRFWNHLKRNSISKQFILAKRMKCWKQKYLIVT